MVFVLAVRRKKYYNDHGALIGIQLEGVIMKIIDMGINTEPPDEERTQDAIERWEELGNKNAVETLKEVYALAMRLKEEIIEAVETDGIAALDWKCVGAIRFNANANCWAAALPQYRFEIERFKCYVYKRE